jgi:hypothetical protein
MADKATPIHDPKTGRITGYRGSRAGEDSTYTAPKKGGVAEGEQTGTSPMPKQADYATTGEWMAALRKWREQQRTAAEGAGALAKKPKPTPTPKS